MKQRERAAQEETVAVIAQAGAMAAAEGVAWLLPTREGASSETVAAPWTAADSSGARDSAWVSTGEKAAAATVVERWTAAARGIGGRRPHSAW